jgi:hypothetical protein
MKHVIRCAYKLIHAELITVCFGASYYYGYILQCYVSLSPIEANVTQPWDPADRQTQNNVMGIQHKCNFN